MQAHVPIVSLFFPTDQSRRWAGHLAMAVAAEWRIGEGAPMMQKLPLGRRGWEVKESLCWPSCEGRPGPGPRVQRTLDRPIEISLPQAKRSVTEENSLVTALC